MTPAECVQPEEPEWDYWHWTPFWPIYSCDPLHVRYEREFLAIPGGVWPHPCCLLERSEVTEWPWWHCPVCGFEAQCPLERMNDGKCADCNLPFLPGRLSAKQAEFFRLAAETAEGPDPLLVSADLLPIDPAGVCEKCGSPIGFGHAFVVSRLVWEDDRSRMVTTCSRCPSDPETMTAERLLESLGGSVDAFEAACQAASPSMLREALAILSSPDPAARPEWAVERKWGAALLERILDGRWSA